MVILRGRRFIFVHIPKNGGTALSLALQARARHDDIRIGDTPKVWTRSPMHQTGRGIGVAIIPLPIRVWLRCFVPPISRGSMMILTMQMAQRRCDKRAIFGAKRRLSSIFLASFFRLYMRGSHGAFTNRAELVLGAQL